MTELTIDALALLAAAAPGQSRFASSHRQRMLVNSVMCPPN